MDALKVPVSLRALHQRINRKLAPTEEVLKKARGVRPGRSLVTTTCCIGAPIMCAAGMWTPRRGAGSWACWRRGKP